MLLEFAKQAILAQAKVAAGEAVEVKFRIPKSVPNYDRFRAVIDKLSTAIQHPTGLVEPRTSLVVDPVAAFYASLEELVGPVMVYNIRRDLADKAKAQGRSDLAQSLLDGMKSPSFVSDLQTASAVEIHRKVGHPNLERALNIAEATRQGEV